MSIEQAREQARLWLGLLRQGLDPQLALRERKRQAEAEQLLTFAAVAERYVEDRLAGKRKAERSAQEIRSELVSRWGDRPLSSISRGDVFALVDELRARAQRRLGARASGAHARICLSHLRSLFNWAVLRELLERSPCDRLRPADLGLLIKPRQRVLDNNEIRGLWKATSEMGGPFGPLIRLLLLTGCRRSEVAGARWSEFDLANKLWVIPRTRAKSDAEHRVPLSADLLELLAALPRYKSGEFLFSSDHGRSSVSGFSKACSRLHRLMRGELGAAMPGFCLHDLRRTFRSRLSEIGIAERIAELAIGHGPKNGLLKVYDRYGYDAEIRSAFERWHTRLRGLVSPPPANVTLLRA
jgi:integrase